MKGAPTLSPPSPICFHTAGTALSFTCTTTQSFGLTSRNRISTLSFVFSVSFLTRSCYQDYLHHCQLPIKLYFRSMLVRG
jgi:hypothetical protein